MLKNLILSNTDSGGAGRAAYRLHQGLQEIGVDSQMLVQSSYSDDVRVMSPQKPLGKMAAKLKLGERLDNLPLKLYPKQEHNFSPQWVPDAIAPLERRINPDIINLHWICHGFIQIETLAKLKKPLVWTMHDMWPFTGGCNYDQECDRYKNSCGQCPQLNSSKDWDLSSWVLQRKAKAWKNINLTIVTPSSWLAKCASSSSLFGDRRIEVIPNGLDTKLYKPLERGIGRSRLNLPHDKQLILFGAMNATSDPRKGFHLLEPALQKLSELGWKEKIELVIFGASRPREEASLGFKSHYLGRLNDDVSLALVYAAADVFVAPSVQENLPNTVMEAIACGTPCVAFNIGGMPDIIEHQQNGYLAQPYESADLAKGIAWVLENRERHLKLAQRARQKAEQEFTLDLQAHRYLSLFKELLNQYRPNS